jgi:hypothetical protein
MIESKSSMALSSLAATSECSKDRSGPAALNPAQAPAKPAKVISQPDIPSQASRPVRKPRPAETEADTLFRRARARSGLSLTEAMETATEWLNGGRFTPEKAAAVMGGLAEGRCGNQMPNVEFEALVRWLCQTHKRHPRLVPAMAGVLGDSIRGRSDTSKLWSSKLEAIFDMAHGEKAEEDEVGQVDRFKPYTTLFVLEELLCEVVKAREQAKIPGDSGGRPLDGKA